MMPGQDWFEAQRSAAAQWARDRLDAGFVIIDSETTGVNHYDELVQIGVISSDGEVLLDTLVKPTQTIDPGAARVHGITPEQLADAPGFSAIYPTMHAILADQQIVAYNAAFDERMLLQTIERYGHDAIPGPLWECAMLNYARFYGKWNTQYNDFKWIKLTDACLIEGIPVEGAHSAASDCLMTLKLMQAMASSLAE